MKKLILLRHAKSRQNAQELADIDRPLKPRGFRDAPMMGQRIAHHCDQPELIVSSPAVRAETTAALVARELSYPQSEIRIDGKLYCFDAGQLLDALRSLDDTKQVVLCVGHNPAIEDLVNQLCGTDIDKVPTCAVCYIQFEPDSWKDITSGRLLYFDYPKNL